MDHLHSTKIIVPQNTRNIVERPRLYSLFQETEMKRATIIQAPAGYGKTTLIIQWMQKKQYPVAWLAIDYMDNDLNRFLYFLFKSVAKACASTIDEILMPLVKSKQSSTYDFLVDAFLNELYLIEEPFYIVLDDFHLIENEVIYNIVTQIVEQLPPHIHLFITSRTEPPLPIARWRVKQWINEISYRHLKFTLHETNHFLTIKKGRRYLSADDIQSIYNKTEGWVTGLLLMRLSTTFDSQIAESISDQYVLDFLWHEIIHDLKPSIQHFLLVTSLLNELDPYICNELTHRTDSEEILRFLEKKGLFIVQIHATKPVFRYHHLFAEALQQEFKKAYSPEGIQEIVEEAATLTYMYGDKVTAIELCLQHQLYDQAIEWISKDLPNYSQSRFINTYIRWLKQLQNNVHFVPYEILIVGYSQAITALDLELSNTIMQELDMRQTIFRWMDQTEYVEFGQIYDCTKAYAIIAARGDLKEVLLILEKHVHKEFTPSTWGKLLTGYNSYEYKLLRTSLAGKGHIPSPTNLPVITNLFQKTSFINLNVSAFITGITAEIYYERNELELAIENIEIAIDLEHKYNDPTLLIPMYLLKAKIYLMQGQGAYAIAMLDAFYNIISEKHWQTTILIMKAYCYIQEDNLAEAEALLNTTKSTQPFWMIVNTRLLLKKKKPKEALQMILHVKTNALKDNQIATLIEATVLEVVCHIQLDERGIALEMLHETFYNASQYYYVRSIIEEPEVIHLIEHYLEDPVYKLKRNELPEVFSDEYFQFLLQHISNIRQKITFTNREQQLVTLLEKEYSNQEIARELKLTVGTVRVYLSNLYKKLGVKSKTQAVQTIKNNYLVR